MGGVTGDIVKMLVGFAMAAVFYLISQVIVRAGKVWNQKLIRAQADAQASGNTAKAAAFNFALTVLDAVTYSVVSKIEAEKAYQLRQAVKAGEAQTAELKLLSSEAYQEIIRQMSSEVKDCLDCTVDDAEQFIRDKIEELLPKVKADYRRSLPGEGKVDNDAEAVEG